MNLESIATKPTMILEQICTSVQIVLSGLLMRFQKKVHHTSSTDYFK